MNAPRQFELQATGLQFHPRLMSLTFSEAFESGEVATFGGSRGKVVAHGSALYKVPSNLGQTPRESELSAALTYFAALVPVLRAAGATEFVLHFRRQFRGRRCNEEFSRQELQLLASLGCHLFYAAEEGEIEA